MDKFVIWGAGERGELISQFLEDSQIIAYIDKDKTKQGSFLKNHQIISFEEYLERFCNYFIIVTPVDEEPILGELSSNNISNYFRMSHLPSEMQGYGDRNFLNLIKIPINNNGNYIIFGLSFYSYILYKKIVNMGLENVYLFSMGESDLENEIKEKLCCDFVSQIDKENDSIFLSTAEKNLVNKLGSKNVIDMFDLSEQIQIYYNSKLKKFHNLHYGKRCFIVATGPSLNKKDLEVLSARGEICFGVNRVFNIDESIWKPLYYIFVDRAGMKKYWDEIVSYNVNEKFLGDSYWKESDYKGNIHIIHALTGHSYNTEPEFSEEIEKKVYIYSTVTYVAIQLAVYMGFTTIYLTGVDCKYKRNSKNNYFFEDKEDLYNHYEDRMIIAYRKAKKYADAHGVKILNASRGGMLEEFERVNFDDIFKEKTL